MSDKNPYHAAALRREQAHRLHHMPPARLLEPGELPAKDQPKGKPKGVQRHTRGKSYIVEPGVMGVERDFARSTSYEGRCSHLTLVKGTAHILPDAAFHSLLPTKEHPAIAHRYRITTKYFTANEVEADYFKLFPGDIW